MTQIELLIVGPVGKSTGGIARYIAEQCRHLPTEIKTATYDTGALAGSRSGSIATVVYRSVVNLFRFPSMAPPDVVHVHTAEAFSFYRNAFYVLFVAYIWRCPVILHVHGPTFDTFVSDASAPVRYLQSVVFAASDAIIVLSDYWYDTLEPHVLREKLTILPNAVNPADYQPSFDISIPHIVFLADHVPRKGIADFAKAIDDLQEKQTGTFHVTIAGTGPSSDHAERVADRYSNVEYRGYLSEAQKRDLLNEASVYVLPTHAEGLPIGILEAMAGGSAVVSTAVGSIPDLIDDDAGVVLDPGDSIHLSDALEHLITSPKSIQEMAEYNRTMIQEKYTWDQLSNQLVQIYRDLSSSDSN